MWNINVLSKSLENQKYVILNIEKSSSDSLIGQKHWKISKEFLLKTDRIQQAKLVWSLAIRFQIKLRLMLTVEQ